uniref:ATP-binding protein n=1 Tax=Butyrivibrio sp. AC2005 TaxID=1280672 RepID=UPI00047E2C3E
MILTYKSVLANAGAQFIQNLISTHPIVIVGCGGTVEDPNLSGFMNFVVDKLGDTKVPYFYLMKNEDNVPELPPNALPVFYGDDYADLPEFLSEMAMMRLRRRAGIRNVVAVNPYKAAVPVTSAFGRIHFSNGFSEFVGRKAELKAITEFIETDKKFSWWITTGEGGIGKSRLVIESLRNASSNWFGFFTKKDANEIGTFIPFTDTIVVFDYVLGSEYECAECLTKYIEIFETSPYKLRVILIERALKSDAWLKDIKKALDSETRLLFEGAEYNKEELRLSELSTDDEISYIQNYFKSYLPLIDNSDLADDYLTDIDNLSKKIQESFRNSISDDYYRPLYLSIFIEVWVGKEGKLSLTSSDELLEEYIEREKIRWKTILDDSDDLLDSYLNLLAMACAID